MKLTAVFEPAPEGGYTCFLEEFPDVFSEGETLDEAKSNLMDAFHQMAAWHRDQARQRPTNPAVVREVVELAYA